MSSAKVELESYNPDWVLKFKSECLFLENVIGNWVYGGIEHVGSTAIPNMVAKPVIDIMVGIESLDIARPAIDVLSNNGYAYSPYKGDVMHSVHIICTLSPIKTHYGMNVFYFVIY